MDRRTVLALVLVAVVVLITPRLFPVARSTARPALAGNGGVPGGREVRPEAASTVDSSVATTAPRVRAETETPPKAERSGEEVTVDGRLARFRFTARGAALEQVSLKAHTALGNDPGPVRLEDPSGGSLLGLRLLEARDTLALSSADFVIVPTGKADSVEMIGQVGSHRLRLSYRVVSDSYVVRVAGTFLGDSGRRAPDFLFIDLPTSLRSFEADTLADLGALSYAVKPTSRSAEGIAFRSLDPGERRLVTGPISWAVAKNKYFMFGVLSGEGDEAVAEVQAVGGARSSRVPTIAHATMIRRIGADGAFVFEVYAGPQEYQRLQAMGRDFENSNPYGGWLQGVVQPFAAIVMKVLLWMKSTIPVSYGWLLVIFGVVVRLVLWPLNQGAMRSSLRMQRVQPELNALQQKHKGDPQRLQSEMMRVYKEHDMSPFSAFAGCLPLLLPMPILFALFFVFQNTIEFRGVPFLWLADISLKDPLYIVPVLMGLSMFVMSWVGMRNMPPNPQAKVMAYVLPVVMTVMFANFASGLNLYYAVQNVAAIPQQWLVAHERAKDSRKA